MIKIIKELEPILLNLSVIIPGYILSTKSGDPKYYPWIWTITFLMIGAVNVFHLMRRK